MNLNNSGFNFVILRAGLHFTCTLPQRPSFSFYTQWDQRMEEDFKAEVARTATQYCNAEQAKCLTR